MKRLVEFSVQNRVLVNLPALFVIGAGLVSYLRMHREMFPEFSRQAIKINTEYLGASPEEVEKLAKEREEARKKEDWQKADEIRQKIKKLGFVTNDTSEGTKLVPLPHHEKRK